MAKSKSTRVRRGDPEFERDYLLKMGLVKSAGQAGGELAGVSYESLCAIHDACVVVEEMPGAVALLREAEPRLPADLFERICAIAEAIRIEVRRRGIPPRFAPSWAALDAEGGMGHCPMSTRRDEQAHSGVGGLPGHFGVSDVGMAPAGACEPIPQSADVTKVQPIKPSAA